MSNANLRSPIIRNEQFDATRNSEKRKKYVNQSPLFSHHGSLMGHKDFALTKIPQMDVQISLAGRKKDPPKNSI